MITIEMVEGMLLEARGLDMFKSTDKVYRGPVILHMDKAPVGIYLVLRGQYNPANYAMRLGNDATAGEVLSHIQRMIRVTLEGILKEAAQWEALLPPHKP